MDRLKQVSLTSMIILLGSAAAAGQHVGVIRTNPVPGAGPGFQAPPNAYPFGNILFPGGVSPHAQRLGATLNGYPTHSTPVGIDPRFNHVSPRNRTVVVPYAFPVFYGDFGYAQQAAPNVTVVIPPQQTPSVIINHNYSADAPKPSMRDYPEGELHQSRSSLRIYEAPVGGRAAAPKETAEEAKARIEARERALSDKPTIYLIALKDSKILSAIGYWIEGDTLNYVTPQGSANRVSLENVDYDLSEQLNAERKVEWDLKKK